LVPINAIYKKPEEKIIVSPTMSNRESSKFKMIIEHGKGSGIKNYRNMKKIFQSDAYNLIEKNRFIVNQMNDESKLR
jgi:hypothetical protein